MNDIIDVETVSESKVAIPNKPKLQILKPDVIVEAISVELQIIEKLKKEISGLQSKIKEKQTKITQCQRVIKKLEEAKTLKDKK